MCAVGSERVACLVSVESVMLAMGCSCWDTDDHSSQALTSTSHFT